MHTVSISKSNYFLIRKLEENPPLNMPEGGRKNALLWKITAILKRDTFKHYLLEDISCTSDWDM